MFQRKMLSSSNSMWNEGMPVLGSVKSLYCRWSIAAADLDDVDIMAVLVGTDGLLVLADRVLGMLAGCNGWCGKEAWEV